MIVTQGALAVQSGRTLEELIAKQLRFHKYIYVPSTSLRVFQEYGKDLFPSVGRYSIQCRIDLVATFHQGRNRYIYPDFVVHTPHNEYVILSAKNQDSPGSCDEKLEYELQRLIATEHKAAILIYGQGWRKDVLAEIWERSKFYGGNRLYLFRSHDRFCRWLDAGMPVSGHGQTASTIFSEFCDREP